MRCTHFTTVSGIVDQGNYSCAQDLALIAHLVLEQPLLAGIVGSRARSCPSRSRAASSTSTTTTRCSCSAIPGTDGVKTGFTDAAGQCLVATVRRGRTWLGVVLLHAGDTSTEAQQMLGAGFAKLRQS